MYRKSAKKADIDFYHFYCVLKYQTLQSSFSHSFQEISNLTSFLFMTYNRILSHTDATSDHAIDTSDDHKKLTYFQHFEQSIQSLTINYERKFK